MAEKKNHLTLITKVANANLMVDLTAIPVGQDSISRIGTRVTLTSVEVRFVTLPPDAPVDSFQNVVFVAVLFSWNDDTIPSPQILWDPLYSSTTVLRQTLLPFNHEHKTKRKILWKKRWTALYPFSPTFTAFSGQPSKVVDIVIPLTRLPMKKNVIEFNPGSISGRNQIWLYIGSSDNGQAITQGSTATGVAKVSYVDL